MCESRKRGLNRVLEVNMRVLEGLAQCRLASLETGCYLVSVFFLSRRRAINLPHC